MQLNERHPIMRCSVSRVFPFGVFYTAEEQEVMIWVVLDLRRDPAWIQERLAE